jgi:ppGpp synthetase/RelA/SpoT-type nucleotidyltranferase
MVNEHYEKTKHLLAFSRTQVDKAGRNFRKGLHKGLSDYDNDVKIIQSFRAAHLYPLQIIKNLVWKHVKKLDLLDSTIVVRRLKRLPTIIDKLQRKTLDGETDNGLSLLRMHDIGGCRVIVENIQDLYALNASLEASRTQHSCKIYDYIERPKVSGYRGIHRVYKSYDKVKRHDYKGYNIEVQVRTRLQHLWAATVEVIDVIDNETLKTRPDGASEDWKRLLAIMSKFFAVEEGMGCMSKEEIREYKNELVDLNSKLSMYDKLNNFRLALKVDNIKKTTKTSAYTLLSVNVTTGQGMAYFYSKAEETAALDKYSELEEDEAVNVLLIAGANIKSIEKAYPNYIIDTTEFLRRFSEIVFS